MGTRSRILVVEDDDSTARLLEFQLEHYSGDVEVQVASDPEAVFEIARATHPDLIVLDVVMHPIGGFEVLRRLRADALTSSIPVVFMSVADHRARAAEEGVAAYIMKPYWPDTLYAVVDRVLGGL